MGHRCNYVVREGGAITLYRSNWGALTVLRDFFWGLESALSFLESENVVDSERGWYDDVFGEGGVAVDRDEQVVVVSGGELEGPARDLCLELMAAVWRRDGYEVREDPSLVGVAGQVGVSARRIEAHYSPRPPLDVDDDEGAGRDGRMHCLVHLDGDVHFCRTDGPLLAAGSEIVPHLGRLPSLEEARRIHASREPFSFERDDGKRPLAHVIRDVVTVSSAMKLLGISASHFVRRPKIAHFRKRWPGWKLIPHVSARACIRDLGIPGLEVPDDPPDPTPEEQLAAVERHLFGGDERLARTMAFLKRMKSEGATVNPRATHVPARARPGDELSRFVFDRAVAEVLGPSAGHSKSS